MIHPFLREQKVFRHRRRWSRWKKRRNLYLNSLSKDERLLATANPFAGHAQKTTLTVPKTFSTSIDIEEVLSFINQCKSITYSRRVLLSFNFRRVEKVNAGALALLLSVIQDLTDLKYHIEGNMPRQPDAKKEFIDSGFLEYFYDNKGRTAACKNKILVQGSDTIKQKQTALEIQKAMYTVFGVSRFNPPLQGALIEMMANSVNHAFPQTEGEGTLFFEQFIENKRWYLSVSHDVEAKKVQFSFIDNGIGILKTIKRGIFRKVVDTLDSAQILQNAFSGDYRSSTRQQERGRGLPTIKDALEKRAICGLNVITNDYLYSFDRKEGRKLANSFEGTVYFWTLDATCSNGPT